MNIFIMLAILLANVIAITLIYQFIKKLPKMEKIIFIGVSFAIMYVLVSISYWISGFGIDDNVNEALKSFVTYIFVPVNIIILIPFVARKYYKLRQNEIGKSDLIKRIIIVSIVGVIILAIETVYFKEIKKDICELISSMQLEENAEKNNSNTSLENVLSNNTITNTVQNVEIVNQETQNNINVNVTNQNTLE